VESRLAVVQQRLTQIAEKKDFLEQSGKLNQVFYLCTTGILPVHYISEVEWPVVLMMQYVCSCDTVARM